MRAPSVAMHFPKVDVYQDPLHRILNDCLRVLSADRCGLFLKDPGGGDFRLITSIGLSEAFLSAARDRWKDLPSAQMLQEPRFLYYPDARNDPRLKAIWPEIREEGYRSAITVPLPSEERPIGVLTLYFDQPREFSPEDTRIIRTFADLVTIAIEIRHLYEREREASRRLDRLQELALQVSSPLDLSQVFRAITKATVELLGDSQSRHSHSGIYLYDESSDRILSRAVSGLSGETQDGAETLALGEGLARRVARNREPLIVPNMQEDPRAVKRGRAKAPGFHYSFIGVPLLASGKFSGVLICVSRENGKFNKTDLDLLESLASHAVAAIEKARAFEEARLHSDRQKALRNVTRDITKDLDLSTLFRRICEGVCRLLGFSIARLFVWDEVSGAFNLTGHFGGDEEAATDLCIPNGTGVLHRVFTRRAPVVIGDVLNDPDYVVRIAEDVQGFVGIPLILQDRVVGALSCFTTEEREFHPDEIEILQDFADQAVVALENARLFHESENRATNLEILAEIAKAVNAALDLNELFRVTVEQVRRAIPCERCSVYKLSPKEGVISRIYAVDDVEERKDRIPPMSLSGSEFEQVLDRRKTVYLPDTGKDPRPRRQALAAEGLRSVINVPILSEGACIGFLNVLSPEIDAYTDGHIELLTSVADHLAVAMKNADLYTRAKASGERLDNFVRSASDGIVTVDLEGRITSWNPGAEAIYGYSEEEILGQNILRIYPEGKGEYKEFWDPLRAGKTVSPFEKIRRRKDGTAVEVSMTVSALRDSQGGLVGYSGIHRDIGAGKRAEEAQRRSEEKYRTLFEEAGDAIHVVDEEGRLVDCNQRLCDLLGYTREEMLKKRVQDFTSSEYKDSVSRRITRIFDEGMPPFESADVRKDGSLIDVEVSAAPFEIEGRRHVIYFLRDITERKRAEEALRNSEARNRAILEAAPDGIVTFDENGVIDSFNPAAERIFGLPASEAPGGDIGTLMDRADARRFEAYLQWYLQTGEKEVFSLSREVVGRRKDASTFPMTMAVNETRLEGRRIFTGIIRDLTEQKAMEARVQKAQKMESTGTLARGIAHDFGNLLTSIQANLTLALAEMKPGGAGFLHLSRLSRAANRAADLVTRLRTLGRDLPVQIQWVDLNQELHIILDLLPAMLPDAIEIETQTGRETRATQADPALIQDLVLNLCLNAKDAMPEGGRLSVGLERLLLEAGHPDLGRDMAPGEYDCIFVRDSGQGMAPEVQDQIFEPFFTTKAPGQGTGLGLPMVQRIVKEHDGFINLQSEPGEGATFWVYLPVRRMESSDPDLPYAGRLASGKGERILLVDDDPLVLDVIEEILSACGYEVTTATSGREAIALFSEGPDRIDLVLTDVVMTDISGREVFRRIRAMRRDVKVLFSSGNRVELPEAVEESGVAFIQKPYALSELLGGVRQMLDRP